MNKLKLKCLRKMASIVSDYLNRHGMIASVRTLGAIGPDGSNYVGNLRAALYYAWRGIEPELSHPDHNVCSIGFCDEEYEHEGVRYRGKWYGWSHRAIYGFGIGDEVKEGDCCAESGWIGEHLKEHPEKDRSLPVGFVAKTIDDTKRMAIAFADSVS